MKRASAVLISILFLAVTSGTIYGAEMEKQGSGAGATYYTSTAQIHAQGKENVVINYEARGVNGTDNEASPFYMSSALCVGSVKGMKGILKESGLCTMTRPDGDQIYMSYEADGKMGVPMKGIYTLVGGTGKCTGITGSGEFIRTSLKGPAEGIGASFSKSTGTWKIP